MPNVNDFLERAKDELLHLMTGEVFLLRELFKGYEWNRISRSDMAEVWQRMMKVFW